MSEGYKDYIKEKIEESAGTMTSMSVKELVRELFLKTDYEGFLNEAMEQNLLTSSDIIHASDIYEAPNEEDMTESEICLRHIEDALDDVEYINLPDIEQLMSVIKSNYEDGDILDCFDNDSLMTRLEGSWEMDNHDSEIRTRCENEYYEQLNEELDVIDYDFQKAFEEKTSDELWQMLATAGNCSYYDHQMMKDVLLDFVLKVQNSNYNVEHKGDIL